MTTPANSARLRIMAAVIAASSLGCSDSSGPTAPPRDLEVERAFAAQLDQLQTVPGSTRGRGVRVELHNPAPAEGTRLSSAVIAFHDGTVDLFDRGAPAEAYFTGVESLAEDGRADFVAADLRSGNQLITRVLGGPIAPGQTRSALVRLNPSNPANRYLSVAMMVLPSNDAFVGNDDPSEFLLFDSQSRVQSWELVVRGSEVLDAGTEVNDELPEHTPLLGRPLQDAGVAEKSVVTRHPGLAPVSRSGILADPRFAAADFKQPGYRVAEIRVSPDTASIAPATGTATFSLSDDDSTLSYDIDVRELSGPVASVTIRRASRRSIGPVAIPLREFSQVRGQLRSRGSALIGDATRSALRAGLLYIEVTTELNPAGEVRGQIQVTSTPL